MAMGWLLVENLQWAFLLQVNLKWKEEEQNIFSFLFLFRSHVWYMEVPRLGVE